MVQNMNNLNIITKRSALIAGALSAVLATTSSAATISWSLSEIVNIGTAQSETGTGFLASDGTLLFAENFGGSALTFDGIAFDAGVFSLGGTAAAFHAAAPLTDPGTFGGSDPAGVLSTIGSGAGHIGESQGATLVLGETYRVQLIVMDGRGNQSGRSYQIDGIDTDHALGTSGSTWGNALLATGTFVADGPSQDFRTKLGPRDDTQFNAIAVHQIAAVPEPSSALFALAGFGLAFRRRR